MKQKGNKKPNLQALQPGNNFFSSKYFYFAAIAAIALLLYIPTFTYQLTYYDDATLIDNMNRFIGARHSFPEIFSQSVFGSSSGSEDYYYRPMLTLSLYLNA